MRWAQFHHNSTGWNGLDFTGPVRVIPACGSDSVFHMDGRLSLDNAATVARVICRKRGFKGFTIEAGARYTDARVIRSLEVLKPEGVA